MIKETLKILIIEDDKNDAQLIEYHINKIVETSKIIKVFSYNDFIETVHTFHPDVILSDYKMNGFTGMEVLKYTITHTSNTNFIFITGTINDEELAAQTILNGATGYILKKNIKELYNKLHPYFVKIAEEKAETKLPEEHKEIIDKLKAYIKSAKKNNQEHIESYNQIKNALEKIKPNK